jgi:hypothetical protein
MIDAKKLIEQVQEGNNPAELVEANSVNVNPKVKKLCDEATNLLDDYCAKLGDLKERASKLSDELDSRSAKSLLYVLSRVCSSSSDVSRSVASIKSGDYHDYY